MIRIYAIGDPGRGAFLMCYWANGVRYALDATHLAHATIFQNKVSATHAINKLIDDGTLPDGFRLLAYDCVEVIDP